MDSNVVRQPDDRSRQQPRPIPIIGVGNRRQSCQGILSLGIFYAGGDHYGFTVVRRVQPAGFGGLCPAAIDN